jgi:hypothetical protein
LSSRADAGRIVLAGLVAAVVASGADALVYLLARGAGVSLFFPYQPGRPAAVLPLSQVVAAVVLGAAAATVAFAVLRLVSASPRPFVIVGIVSLVVTWLAPLRQAVGRTADGATVVTLLLMHVVAGASIIGLLAGLGAPTSNRAGRR